MMTVFILLIAFGGLGWGFYRAKPFGKLGILAWLQSAVLIAPWLTFFSLFVAGIYLNLAGILLLFVLSIGLYIFLGNRLRAAGTDEALLKHTPGLTESHQEEMTKTDQTAEEKTSAVSDSTLNTPRGESATSVEATSMPAETLKKIQGIFGIDTFFATETIPYQNGVIFKGNLRGEAEESYIRLSANLAEKAGSCENAPDVPLYRLFLVEGPDGKPVAIVLPSANDPKPTSLVQNLLAVGLILATIATSLETAGLLLGFDFFTELNRFRETLPIGGGILLILAAHEVGHRVLAHRHRVRLSPPFLIPTWQIGSFGALTRFESLLSNRNVLFDIAFAGPAAGGLLSLVVLITGLLLSHQGSLFQIPSEFFQGSILVGSLARVILGAALQQPLVNIHPLVVLGWLGLVMSAINLMPAGQLDGGRIVQSIYGRKVAGRTTIATLIVLGLATLVNPLALYWALVILFLQRDLERPALNEISELNDTRAALGLLALFLMVATLLPLTPSLAGRLGIGG